MARVKRGTTTHARHKKILDLDRKVLSDIAIREPEAFQAIAVTARAALGAAPITAAAE